MSKKAYLCLEDGTVLQGKSFGAEGTVVAELVFTTAMTGYLETLTDPSYYGQIVLQTFPLIGNVGIIPEDFESQAPALRGYIVKDPCDLPSNFRGSSSLDAYLKSQGVVGLYGIDTRALTKRIREHGVMNAVLTTDPEKAVADGLADFAIREAVPSVTTDSIKVVPAAEKGPRIVLWDFGAKDNIERELSRRGATVIRMPAESTREEILAQEPDALMLSNGPGDPEEAQNVIAELKKLQADKLPTFGICLGHQLLALAHGFSTFKLKYGHRGANQPVRDLVTDRIFITSQNHGYAVDNDTIDPAVATKRFINSNDGTCEGIDYIDEPTFSVQYHPEACGGPKDTEFLFDRFFDMMEVK
ncbi:MAG: carbamoyl phosphate synthase small subunit [Peptococcaceae bacterium]|nr:carbamoyl phosphate synthase small subunit [Peptococcaceae bacterium]